MTLAKNKLAVAIAIALTTSLGLVGCGDDKSVSSAVGVPNPNALTPTGTIQGVLRDSVTNEPIVGAIVDIGIAKATTTETGQFVIANVPATANIGAAAAGANTPYQVTVDLRNVKQAAGAAKYPNFSFSTAAVTYSSLNDGSNDAGTSSSNHDTPVTGLVAPLNLTVGKLAAGIKGTVAKAMDFKAVGAGYTVKLVSLGSSNSTTGATGPLDGKFLNGNVVATTTTDAAGAFVFSGIESLRDFQIEVVNADATEYGFEPVRAPADGQVKTLLAQRGEDALDLRTVLVKSTDTLAPRVVKSTPETGTERAPGANVAVTFSFSEPIISNGLTNSLTASTAGNGGLYDLVSVNFTGIKDIAMKASNIPYSLAWDATRTQLTVIIPKVKASAKYEVSIAGAKGILLDNQGYETDFGFTGATSANAGVVKFSTNADGATKPAAVSTLAINNNADLDQTNNAVVDWLPVAGAKGYHVYRAKFVNDVMDSKGYEPITRTATDAVADTAERNAKQVIADAAKTAAATAAQVSVQAGQNANVADVTANTAIKAAAPTTGAVADATAASAALTATAATDARAADKVAALSVVSDKDSASKVSAANISAMSAAATATSSNSATATIAKDKVKGVNDAVVAASGKATAAATAATTANTNVRTVNTKAMVAAKVAATVNAVADVAAAISAVSAADSSVALAKRDAAQAAVDADPSNQAKKNVLAVAQTAFNNANKAAVDKAKEAKVAADAAKKALEAANKAKDDAMGAATKANADSVTAANAVEPAKTDAEGKATANTNAQKALTDAQKALTDANTAAEKEDAAVDLQKAKDAVEAAKLAANTATGAAVAADRLADEAAAAAVAAADASTASTAAAKAATDAATAATAAVAAITTAVNAADAAADNVDLATASSAANNATFEVLDNNAKIVDGWRAYTAAAVAKAMAAAKVMVVTDAESTAAKTAVADAAKQAADVVKAAQDIVAKATIAQTAVAATQTAAAAAATKAVTNDTAAKTTVTTATTAVTTAATTLTTAAAATTTTDAVKTAVAAAVAAVGTPDATAKTAAAKVAADAAKVAAADAKVVADAAKVVADAAAAAAVGTPNAAATAAAAANAATVATNAATAATNTATAATNAATTATNAANVVGKVNNLIKAQLVEKNAIDAAAAAAIALTKANNAKKAADTALTDVTAAKTAADKALVDANTAKVAADKLVTSMNAAETSLKTTVVANAAAVKATADALTASNDAVTAAKTAASAAATKQQADKALATAVKEKAAADKALADAQGVIDSNGGYVANTNGDKYLTQNTSFVQGSEDGKPLQFADGIRKVTYKYTVRAVSEDNVESDAGNEVEAKDNTKPKVSSFTMNTASNVVTVVFNEPMNELDFRNQANYVLSAPTGATVTLPALSNALFKIDSKTVVLSYASNIPAGSTVTVKGLKDLAGNAMSEVGNSASVSKVSSNIAGFIGSTQVTVFFTAEMDKASAETAANYALPTGPALLAANGVVYNEANNSVTLTYVSAIPAGVTLTVSGVKDANGTVVESNTKQFN